MSVECLQIRPGPRPLVHFTGEELTGWCSRPGAPDSRRRRRRLGLRGRCALRPFPARGCGGGGRRTRGGGPFASVPRTETSPGLEGQIRFLPLDSTSLVWKSSEEVVIFSKGIWFHACVITPESTCFSPRSSTPTPVFLFDCHPSFWTKDRTCFVLLHPFVLRVF